MECQNCKYLQHKIYYLIESLAKFTLWRTNLEVVLGSQNCAFYKVGIGYKPFLRNKVKQFKSLFSYREPNVSPFLNCFYCTRKGHSIKKCKIRKYNVPYEKLKWMPKCAKKEINIVEPKLIRVPYFATKFILQVHLKDNK